LYWLIDGPNEGFATYPGQTLATLQNASQKQAVHIPCPACLVNAQRGAQQLGDVHISGHLAAHADLYQVTGHQLCSGSCAAFLLLGLVSFTRRNVNEHFATHAHFYQVAGHQLCIGSWASFVHLFDLFCC